MYICALFPMLKAWMPGTDNDKQKSAVYNTNIINLLKNKLL